MISLLVTLVAFIVTLGILVSFHELGHFWVARRCGVKVLRFSIGFGKPLIMRKDRYGTEYVIAAIPLGGYVKMLHKEQTTHVPNLVNDTFDGQPVWKKLLIVGAGPFANLLLAVILFWIMYGIGITTVIPVIGSVRPNSIAQQIGLEPEQEIIAVGNHATPSWSAIQLALLHPSALDQPLAITTRKHITNTQTETNTHYVVSDKLLTLEKLGVVPFTPPLKPILGSVELRSVAAQAGLHSGDKIIQVNRTKINDWQQFAQIVRRSPNTQLNLEVDRQGQILAVSLFPQTHNSGGTIVGYIGVESPQLVWPKQYQRKHQYSLWRAWQPATQQTYHIIRVTLHAIGQMLTGQLSLRQLSGPVGIAQAAGNTVHAGLSYYLGFLAVLSISLGVLNLLPIPLLDGGYFLYYVVEFLIRRPVPEKVQLIGTWLGISILLGFTLVALFNDIQRLLIQ
ncbi:MAG: sigma E protease regulator RseP [Gammaproteobacteria bacterium]